MNQKISFSVITATFNGEKYINRLYQSLLEQKYKDFEWIIIDDGSKDGTLEKVQSFIKKNELDIYLIKQKHAHKKTAINKGVKKAKFEFAMVIDDDDYLIKGSLLKINNYWQSIPYKIRDSLSGMTFNSMNQDRSIIGNKFPQNKMITSEIKLRAKFGLKGDKFFVKKTNLMKQNLFNENILGYVPETMMLNAIESKHPAIFVNDAFRIYDQTRQKKKRKSWGSHKIRTSRGRFHECEEMLCNAEWLYLHKYRIYFLKICINFIRFYLLKLVFYREFNLDKKPILENLVFVFLSIPIGIFVFLLDMYYFICEDKSYDNIY